jgi:hypothetical protein
MARYSVKPSVKSHVSLLSGVLLFLFGLGGDGQAHEAQLSPAIQINNNIGRVNELTNLILKEEIDLERFYTRYRIAGSKEPRLRRLRYFLLQQAATSLFLGSNIVSVQQFGGHLSNPKGVSIRALRNSNNAGLIASAFEGGSSGLEFGSNWFLARTNKKHERDPGFAKRIVRIKLEQIENLLAERDQLLGNNGDDRLYELCLAEGDVLRYFRDWCVYEFADAYADIKSYQASNNVYYALDVTSSSVYLASYVLSYRGLYNPFYFASSSIVGIVGDSLGIVSAPGSSLAYKLLYKHQTNRLSKYLGQQFYDAEAKTKNAVAKLEELSFIGSQKNLSRIDQLRTRLTVYKLWAERHHVFIEKRETELRRLSKIAEQSNIAGPLISGAFLQQDIIGAVAGYRLRKNLKASNNSVFAAAIPITAASGSSFALTSYWFVDDVLHTNYLKRRNELPLEMLQKRLITLDELSSILDGSIK